MWLTCSNVCVCVSVCNCIRLCVSVYCVYYFNHTIEVQKSFRGNECYMDYKKHNYGEYINIDSI